MTISLKVLLLGTAGAASIASAAPVGDAQPAASKRGFPGQQKKWGVAWPKNNNPLQINSFLGYNGWWYNWESTPNGISPSNGMPFVPMMHTLGGSWNDWFTNDVINNQGNFPSKTVMMFNEPDNSATPVSPQAACGAWGQFFAPLKNNGWKVIGPALANPAGDWYQQFKNACPDVESQIDFGNLHYYQTDPSAVTSGATNWHNQFGKPLYITEVACWNFGNSQCSDPQSFLTQVGQWAAGTDWVQGIAPFGFWEPNSPNQGGVGNVDALANSDGSPSALYEAWEQPGKNV